MNGIVKGICTGLAAFAIYATTVNADDCLYGNHLDKSLEEMQNCMQRIGQQLPDADHPDFSQYLEDAIYEIQDSHMLEHRHPAPLNPDYVVEVESEKGMVFAVDWDNYTAKEAVKDCLFCEEKNRYWAPNAGPVTEKRAASCLVTDLEAFLEDASNEQLGNRTRAKIGAIKEHYNLD